MTQQLRRALGKQDNFLNEIEAQGVAHDGRDLLLQRLLAGSRWLTSAHTGWVAGRADSPTDVKFSAALSAWGGLERDLRDAFGFEGCIYGAGQRCPADAPVICGFCSGEPIILGQCDRCQVQLIPGQTSAYTPTGEKLCGGCNG